MAKSRNRTKKATKKQRAKSLHAFEMKHGRPRTSNPSINEMLLPLAMHLATNEQRKTVTND